MTDFFLRLSLRAAADGFGALARGRLRVTDPRDAELAILREYFDASEEQRAARDAETECWHADVETVSAETLRAAEKRNEVAIKRLVVARAAVFRLRGG